LPCSDADKFVTHRQLPPTARLACSRALPSETNKMRKLDENGGDGCRKQKVTAKANDSR
jgi:hypothetical protein